MKLATFLILFLTFPCACNTVKITKLQDIDNDGYSEKQGDCDDGDDAIYPGAADTPYDGIDQDCSGADLVDVDGDGYDSHATDGTDCDDHDASAHPGATDTPYDGIDQDCSGADLTDVDGDGYDSDAVDKGTDCDDDEATAYPGATEIPYDGIDQDCSGADLTDVDSDGYDSRMAGGDDCDDEDSGVHPGVAFDDCGSGDEDCDDQEDEDQDADADGWTTCEGDCDDANRSVNPEGTDVPLDGIDQDCDGHDMGNCSIDTLCLENLDIDYDDCRKCSSGSSVWYKTIERVSVPVWARCEGLKEGSKLGATISWDGDWSDSDGDETIAGFWSGTIYNLGGAGWCLDGDFYGSGDSSYCGYCDTIQASFHPDED